MSERPPNDARATTEPPWLRGPLLGALVGLPMLGGGGRLAMRLIALLQPASASVSVEGTLTVLLAGLASGVGGGLLYALLYRLLPNRRGVRGVLFALALGFLALRGLHPVRLLPLALFAPLVVAYGVMLEWAWHSDRRRLRTAGAQA